MTVVLVALVVTVGVGGAVLSTGSSAGVLSPQLFDQQPETEVRLEPASDTVDSGGSTTYDVVVEDADGGVGVYDFTVDVDDSTIASITDVSLNGNPGEASTDVTVAENGSVTDVDAARANTNDTGRVTIATVTVTGDDIGDSDIRLNVDALETENNEAYTTTDTTDASITVETPPGPPDFRVASLNGPTDVTVPASTTLLDDRTGAEGGVVASGAAVVGEATGIGGATEVDGATPEGGLDVDVDVTNDGEERGTRLVEFRLDHDGNGRPDADETVTVRHVSLGAGESETITFESLDTGGLGPGEYTYGVYTGDDSATATTAVEASRKPADFQVTNLSRPTNVTVPASTTVVKNTSDDDETTVVENTTGADTGTVADNTTVADGIIVANGTTVADGTTATDGTTPEEGVDVSVDVTNDGDENATRAVEFRLDRDGNGRPDADETVAERNVSLEAGETETVTFGDLDARALGPGEHAYGVYTDDDSTTATVAIETAPAPETAVSLRPDAATVDERDSATYDVVAEGADGGVGAYDFTLTVDDSRIASISDVAVPGNSTVSATRLDDDGASVDATGRLTDTNASGNVTIATVTVDGDAVGTSDIGLTTNALGTDADESYNVTGTNGASITVEGTGGSGWSPSPDPEPAEEPEFTREDISQAKYGTDFGNLSVETAGEVLAISNRQPFPDGTEPADIRTRDEITDDRYGYDFDELDRGTTIEVQNAYDEQFGSLPSDPAFGRDDIAQSKYGVDFGNLSAETAGEVQAIYNRQPLPDGTEPVDVRTREQIAEDRHGRSFDELGRGRIIEVQNAYDEQFAGDR
ncbi:hypothetical protein DQW50_00875 [Halorubrum sp. 48-1-W]|uniref:hypothetical protein n=1 Tax=Halorubrum sp. 48-1-W TaxID=2249761 RepID=UPI000DCE6B18|nr:hypothetical protein [Halorubrum sp. 48-1-W]RAW46972.1 hypothetical protein DQW50_00875 [Halorubrum sp. 48-1-W]